MLQNIESVPEKWYAANSNNDGRYFIHLFYWATVCSSSKGPSEVLDESLTPLKYLPTASPA